MEDVTRDEHFEKLVRLLDPKNKKTDVEDIDLKQALEGFVQKFLPHTSLEELEDDTSKQFSYAGHVLQSSANVFSKKVDGLYELVRSLMDDLTTKRELAEKKKAEQVNDSPYDDDFHDMMDEVKVGKHTTLTEEDEAEMEPIEYITDPPSCMMDFGTNSGNRIPLWDYNGKLMGHQQDFAMGSSYTLSSTGAFSLTMKAIDDQFQDKKEDFSFADDGIDGASEVVDAMYAEPKPSPEEDMDEPAKDDTEMKSIKRECQDRQAMLKKRIEAALEPHDPYQIIELRDETQTEKKIHEPVNVSGKQNPPPSLSARLFLEKEPLGKGPRRPDPALKDLADKEFLARRKNLRQRAKEDKEVPPENEESDEDNGPTASGGDEDDDDQRYDPVNFDFDELDIHDDDNLYDEVQEREEAQDAMRAMNAAAQQQLNTEENKKAYEAWEERMQRVLEEEKDLPEFDIGGTMNEILENMENKPDSVAFHEVLPMKSAWDVSRGFLGTLILTNQGNLNIIDTDKDTLPASYSASDLPISNLKVKFLNKDKKEDHIRSNYEIEADKRIRRDQKRVSLSGSFSWSTSDSSCSSSREQSPEPQPHCSKKGRPRED